MCVAGTVACGRETAPPPCRRKETSTFSVGKESSERPGLEKAKVKKAGYAVSAEVMEQCYWAEHRFSMVLIEVIVNATDGDPSLPDGLELVLNDGDSFPITSTCCPR